jgi:hypothetical protein
MLDCKRLTIHVQRCVLAASDRKGYHASGSALGESIPLVYTRQVSCSVCESLGKSLFEYLLGVGVARQVAGRVAFSGEPPGD